jgi:N-acetylmuramoyl-L-alanine amidase
MRRIDLIVIHCTASPNGRWITAADIDGWHKARGFRRDSVMRLQFNPDLFSIGYHHVIYTNGAIATGRSHDEVGAHVTGHNANSLGIAMVGTDRFSAAQWASLRELIQALTVPTGRYAAQYPNARICGHRDLSPDRNGDGTIEPQEWLKTCPGFDVAKWRRGGMEPLADQLMEKA